MSQPTRIPLDSMLDCTAVPQNVPRPPLRLPRECIEESPMKKLAVALTPALLAGAATAQTASYTYTDQQAPYTNPGANRIPPGPWLRALNLPHIGTTFRVEVPQSFTQGMCCPNQTFRFWLDAGPFFRGIHFPRGADGVIGM